MLEIKLGLERGKSLGTCAGYIAIVKKKKIPKIQELNQQRRLLFFFFFLSFSYSSAEMGSQPKVESHPQYFYPWVQNDCSRKLSSFPICTTEREADMRKLR